MNSLTEQAATVLQEIDAALALADKATAGEWSLVDAPRGEKEVSGPSGFWAASVQCCAADAAFIAASRTVCPKSLRCLKTAIEGCLDKKSWDASIHQMYIRQDAEEILTTLINQWNSK